MAQEEDSTVFPSSAPSSAPTPAPNECDGIEIDSIYFFLLTSIDPNEVAFFLFEDLPGNTEILLTDNAWTGQEFQSDEDSEDEGVLSVSISSY